jgi:acetyltransferase-like isoleucine patch superfamily enzyme
MGKQVCGLRELRLQAGQCGRAGEVPLLLVLWGADYMEVMERLEALKLRKRHCEISQAMWKNDLIEVGDFTYGRPIVLQWDKTTRLTIGKFCSIGANVQIYLGGEHHTDLVTTYPLDVVIDGKPTPSKGNVTIGNDVWIGNNVQILSGVTIRDGAVVGAGSVVSKSVPEYAVVAGNPAKFKRFRINTKPPEWWDWPLEKIAEKIPMLMSERWSDE